MDNKMPFSFLPFKNKIILDLWRNLKFIVKKTVAAGCTKLNKNKAILVQQVQFNVYIPQGLLVSLATYLEVSYTRKAINKILFS